MDKKEDQPLDNKIEDGDVQQSSVTEVDDAEKRYDDETRPEDDPELSRQKH